MGYKKFLEMLKSLIEQEIKACDESTRKDLGYQYELPDISEIGNAILFPQDHIVRNIFKAPPQAQTTIDNLISTSDAETFESKQMEEEELMQKNYENKF